MHQPHLSLRMMSISSHISICGENTFQPDNMHPISAFKLSASRLLKGGFYSCGSANRPVVSTPLVWLQVLAILTKVGHFKGVLQCSSHLEHVSQSWTRCFLWHVPCRPHLIWLRSWWQLTLWLANVHLPKQCWCPASKWCGLGESTAQMCYPTSNAATPVPLIQVL